MSIVRASSKFQIAIPKAIRSKLGIEAGQRFLVSDVNGAISLTPIPADPVEYLCGVFQDEPSMTAELVRERKQDLDRE
jgi:AbrB family looped-hinge helix DNA binding protein